MFSAILYMFRYLQLDFLSNKKRLFSQKIMEREFLADLDILYRSQFYLLAVANNINRLPCI